MHEAKRQKTVAGKLPEILVRQKRIAPAGERRNVKSVNSAAFDSARIAFNAPFKRDIRKRSKASAACDFNGFARNKLRGVLLIYALHVIVSGARSAVGKDQTVNAAYAVVREVPEVAAVVIAGFAVFIRDIYRMVGKLPYAPSGEIVILFDKLPVCVNIARGHRADVFAKPERLGVLGVIKIFFRVFDVGIHSALNIGYIRKALALRHRLELKVRVFIMNERAPVAGADILCHGAVIFACTRLVAQRPHYNAASVFVALKQPRGAVNIGGVPVRRIRKI